MIGNSIPGADVVCTETSEEHMNRLAAERRLIEEAEAEIKLLGTIPAEEVHAWLRSLDTANPLPMPEPRRT